jgi:hypothetical protein
MATFLASASELVHGTVSTLIDNQVTSRLTDTATGLVTSGFKAVEEILKITQDLTAPGVAPASQPDPPQPVPGGQP